MLEQRTAALATTLAEAQVAQERLGQRPILLLDDAPSELDSARGAHVLELAQEGFEVLATTTALSGPLEAWGGEVTRYAVTDGSIERVGRP